MSIKRMDHAALAVPNVGVVIAGGRSFTGDVTAIEALDLDADAWTPLNPSLAYGNVESTVLLDGRWMLFDIEGTATYDPQLDAWVNEPGLQFTFRTGATINTLPTGDVLVTGGFADFYTFPDSLRYDPNAQTIAEQPALIEGRAYHTATTLPSGLVLAAGGWGWAPGEGDDIQLITASCELYDYLTDEWSPAASMNLGREQHASVLLPSGQVLATGGLGLVGQAGKAVTSTAEIYDPANDSWTPVASMAHARYGHTITLLPSGRVIVTGGVGPGGAVSHSVEVYDPQDDTWTSLPSMLTTRQAHAATLVDGHGLLVTGGRSSASFMSTLSSVELFPLGQSPNGTPCVIDDECMGTMCTPGNVCAGPGGGGGPTLGDHSDTGGGDGPEVDLEPVLGCTAVDEPGKAGSWGILGLGLLLLGVRSRRGRQGR